MDDISREERFKLNVVEVTDNFRGKLRNCDQVFVEYNSTNRWNKLFITKPQNNK